MFIPWLHSDISFSCYQLSSPLLSKTDSTYYACMVIPFKIRLLLYDNMAYAYYLLITVTLNDTDRFPYSFSATQIYSPLSVIFSAVKIRTLSLLVLGQDEQDSGINQVYTGSGDDDTLQFNITSLPTLTVTV